MVSMHQHRAAVNFIWDTQTLSQTTLPSFLKLKALPSANLKAIVDIVRHDPLWLQIPQCPTSGDRAWDQGHTECAWASNTLRRFRAVVQVKRFDSMMILKKPCSPSLIHTASPLRIVIGHDQMMQKLARVQSWQSITSEAIPTVVIQHGINTTVLRFGHVFISRIQDSDFTRVHPPIVGSLPTAFPICNYPAIIWENTHTPASRMEGNPWSNCSSSAPGSCSCKRGCWPGHGKARSTEWLAQRRRAAGCKIVAPPQTWENLRSDKAIPALAL